MIPSSFDFIDKKGDMFEPSVFHKIDKALPTIKGAKFKNKNREYNNIVRILILLRNEIIHLKPITEPTNTKYKKVYRKLINMDYSKAILAVKELVNFYEPNLIEECECQKEHYYDILEHNENE